MKTSTRFLLAMTVWAAGGCQWVAGIEDTTVAVDAGLPPPVDAPPPADAPVSPPGTCPAPCLGDAVTDFVPVQDGLWRYLEVVPATGGPPQYRDMTYAVWNGLSAWVGIETAPPAIVSCPANAGAAECLGVEQKLLLVPAAGENQPALVWSAPKTGSFRLTADWRIADASMAGSPGSVLVTRNGMFDSLYETTFLNSTTPSTLDLEVEAAAGDALALTVIPGDDAPVPLGVSFFVTDLGRTDACQMMFQFLGTEAPFDDLCENGNVMVEAGTMPTQPAGPPPGVPGLARTFSDDSFLLYEGDFNDYSGDWTLQFWAALEGPGTILSDRSCTNVGRPASGGIDITFDGETVYIAIGEEISGTDYCAPSNAAGIATFSTSIDFESAADWHFYRIVRDKQAGTVTACVDGRTGLYNEPIPVPEGATMATDRFLELGRRADLDNGSFEGTLADLRVYSRALPCPL